MRSIFVRFLIILQLVQIPDCAISWALAVVFLIVGHMRLQAVSPSFSTKIFTLSFLLKLQGKLAFNISAQNFKTANHPKGYDQMASICFLVFQHSSFFLLLWFDSGTLSTLCTCSYYLVGHAENFWLWWCLLMNWPRHVKFDKGIRSFRYLHIMYKICFVSQ